MCSLSRLARNRSIVIFLLFIQQACQKERLVNANNGVLEFGKLSDYKIYAGNPIELVPNGDYQLYEISSQLFTDHAKKQRLIKLPANTTLRASDDGLPEFPEGTIIVKTFYYYNDERNHSLGKKLIETRVLLLRKGNWVAGTYYWNQEQTDAYLTNAGIDRPVNWIDNSGDAKVLSYHIPSNLECSACHSNNKAIQPIGPKVRNLNFPVDRDGIEINQLEFLALKGVLGRVDPEDFASTPNYNDGATSIGQRTRAYLDINCAHCHSNHGSASNMRYRFEFETDADKTKIEEGKASIKHMLEKGYMPKIGTTTIDAEGVDLINQYLKTL